MVHLIVLRMVQIKTLQTVHLLRYRQIQVILVGGYDWNPWVAIDRNTHRKRLTYSLSDFDNGRLYSGMDVSEMPSSGRNWMVADNAPGNESPTAAFLHFLLTFYLFFIGERASFWPFRLELLADIAPEYLPSTLIKYIDDKELQYKLNNIRRIRNNMIHNADFNKQFAIENMESTLSELRDYLGNTIWILCVELYIGFAPYPKFK